MVRKKRGKVKSSKSIKQKSPDKTFWFAISGIFFLSIITIISQTSGFSFPTGAAIQNVACANQGTELFFEVNVNGIKDLNIKFNQDVKNVQIKIDEIESIKNEFNGIVHSKFIVTSEDADKFGELTFTLKIKEEDINNIGINKNELKLYQNGKELETKADYKKGDYTYYIAKSNKVGEFVIGKINKAKEVTTPVVKEKVETAEEPTVVEITEEQNTEPIIEQPAPVKKGFFQLLGEYMSQLFS